MDQFTKCSKDTTKVCKVDSDRRMVFGWAQICTKNGEEYFDTDNQSFPETVTLGDDESGWIGYMKSQRIHKAMHSGEQVGEVIFAFPAFDDIMKSLGYEPTDKTGIIVGVQVHDDKVLQKFHSGEYSDFSIGGGANFDEVEV